MKKLTDIVVQAAMRRASAGTQDLFDAAVPGLALRIGQRVASWSLTVRVAGEGGISARGFKKKGKRTRLNLGEYPTVSLQAARAAANAYHDQAARGESPVVRLEQAATTGGLTVRTLGEKFVTDYVQTKELRALLKYGGALRVHVFPRIGDELVETLSRATMRDLLKAVSIKQPRSTAPRGRPRGGKEAARTVVAVMRKMINWGIAEDLITRKDNPAEGMESNLPKKKKKDTVLSLEDARVAYRAAASLGYPFGPLYQLILLTGCRPGEWGNCRVPYLDLKQQLLVIPADAYKTGHVHVVPLVPEAVKILENVLAYHSGKSGDYVFSGTDGRKPVLSWSKAQTRIEKACLAETGEIPKVRWTPHDLRRTVATRIAEQLGIEGEKFVKRVLGHSDGSVTAIYNRYGYVKEIRRVLGQWVKELTVEELGNVAEEEIAA